MKTLWMALVVLTALALLAPLGRASDCRNNMNNGATALMGQAGHGASRVCINAGQGRLNITCQVTDYTGKANLLITEVYFAPNRQYVVPITSMGQEFTISGQGTEDFSVIVLEYDGPWSPDDHSFRLTCRW